MKCDETEGQKKGEKRRHGVVMNLRRKGVKLEPSKSQSFCSLFCYLKHVFIYSLVELDFLL